MKPQPATPFSTFFYRNLVVGRWFIFGAAIAAPHRLLRVLRIEGDGTPAPMLLRMTGIRNGALALGLTSLRNVRSPRMFVAINVLCDVVDALAFIDARRRGEISRAGAITTTTIAASAAVAGAITYAGLPVDAGRAVSS